MHSSLKKDVMAGFSVFLLALPLCLGIAMASNYPSIAGIISAIVGGVIASFFGGAKLSIKGPAAGLIVIATGAVTDLGYECALAVGVVAALIQIGIGLLKKAVMVEVMPPFVIHGMLSAIGVIIISQQLYVMMGLPPASSQSILSLVQLPLEIMNLNPLIFLFGMISFVMAVCWPYLKKISMIPSTIAILIIVIPFSFLLGLRDADHYFFWGKEYALGTDFLINIPDQIFGSITFPDFSSLFTGSSLKYIILFALVGSIESLLTVCAIDEMTPENSPSDLNHDLIAVGVGNLVSSLIGGLPMISEIVRSKANIDYGATSQRSNITHGICMLIAVLVIPGIINLIPLSVLAAILVFVGFRLAAPHQFIHAFKVGKEQFIVFSVTFMSTLMFGLLNGVILGVFSKLFIHMLKGNRLNQLISPSISIQQKGQVSYIEIDGPLTFLGYTKLKSIVVKACENSESVVVNLNAVTLIDHTVSTKLKTLSRQYKNMTITIDSNQQLVHF